VHPQFRVGREVGHLAHRTAGAELGHGLAVTVDIHLALGHDVEGVAFLALAEQRLAEGVALPLGPVHHFPQFDVAEVGEEFERAQQREALGIQHVLARAVGQLAAGAERRQHLGKLVPVRGPQLTFLGQAAFDERLQRRRHALAQGQQRRRGAVVDLVHDGLLLLRLEGRAAGDQVVEHGGQRVDVGAAVEHVAVELFGRHIGQAADAEDLGLVGALVEDAAEVGHLDLRDLVAIHLHQQVGGLHVAVDQALAVAVAQRHRALEAHFHDLRQRQQAVGAAVAAQRAAADVFHHQIGRIGVGHGVEDLHHVGVVQPPDQRRLGGKETLLVMQFARIGQQAAAHALDRDIEVGEAVVGQEDLARGAFTDLGLHLVLADVAGRAVVGRSGFGVDEFGQRHGGWKRAWSEREHIVD